MTPDVSLIVSAYEQVSELERVLWALSRQTHPQFEVVVADDGSGPALKAMVEVFAVHAPFPLRHVYQPDEGFRKSAILNAAVRTSRADYLVFADGDCVPHRDFVGAHCRHRAPNTVLCGRRVLLDRVSSDRLTPDQVRAGWLDRLTSDKVVSALLGRGSHWDEAILIDAPFVRRLVCRKEPSVLGTNFSLERSLFERVNGYDESFIGYGGEETDLEERLRAAGARFRWVTHQAIQYHLYHPRRVDTVRSAAPVTPSR